MSELESKQIDVRGDGSVILYKREGLKKPKYQARIRVRGAKGYKRISTKTDNLREAERFALNLYDDLAIHVRAGGALNSRSFAQVFDEWSKAQPTLGPTKQGGTWESTVDRVRTYSVPYFGQMKIDQITSKEFAEYWLWRKVNFNRKAPSDGTLRREKTCLVPLFRYAKAKGYILELPDFAAPSVKPQKRPTFSPEEWRKIYRRAREWIKEGQGKSTWRDRFLSWQYFLVLANSGLRVGEARALRWSDLRPVGTDDGTRLVAEVYGKTGHREAVFQAVATEYVKRVYDLRRDELGREPQLTECVFVHPDGRPIQSMKRSFNSLLEYSGVAREKYGKSRTIYSLRHFYATQRLSEEISPFLLAKQMGTSVEMLEKHYGHIVTSSLAKELTRGVQRPGKGVSGDYPFD